MCTSQSLATSIDLVCRVDLEVCRLEGPDKNYMLCCVYRWPGPVRVFPNSKSPDTDGELADCTHALDIRKQFHSFVTPLNPANINSGYFLLPRSSRGDDVGWVPMLPLVLPFMLNSQLLTTLSQLVTTCHKLSQLVTTSDNLSQ